MSKKGDLGVWESVDQYINFCTIEAPKLIGHAVFGKEASDLYKKTYLEPKIPVPKIRPGRKKILNEANF